MKKILSLATLSAFLLIPAQGAFAWSDDGLNRLKRWTGFRNCNKCEKIKKHKCHKPKKCNKCAQIKLYPKRCARAFN